jgi:hypothetical protein
LGLSWLLEAKSAMTEAAIVLGLVVMLVVVGTLVVSLPWTAIVFAGAGLIAFGFVLGVPTGFYYHVALYKRLAPRNALPARWYWSPVRYHPLLRDDERMSVLRWFYLGATGFVLIVLGGAVMALGLMFAG